MSIEINLAQFGDYGILFVDLVDGLREGDHSQVAAASERMAQLARQKVNEANATPDGVVKP